MTAELVDAIAEMRDDEAVPLAEKLLETGTRPIDILGACREAMAIVGRRFEEGEYFVPELILAGEMLREISELVKPLLAASSDVAKHGRIVLGTVAGDIHDIGKDIVYFMLDVNGFEVHDLGVDVPVDTFVEKVRELQPQVLALSGFLTLSYDAMKETVEALVQAGIRDTVKVMIGGGTVDEQVREYAGADAFGSDAMAAVTLARQWIGVAA
ncbi:MAG TPA: cobalamin-dependent protein [Kineosporiaceae bacterium]|nr:cobalamin-dependent protein [Kineosporiaceae bacterium]